MALASLFVKIEELEKEIKNTGFGVSASSDNDLSSTLKKIEEQIDELTTKVSAVEIKLFSNYAELSSKISALEARPIVDLSALTDLSSKLSTAIQANSSINLVKIEERLALLESK